VCDTLIDCLMNVASTQPSVTRKWTVVSLLALGMVIAYVDRANFSVVLALKDFRLEFHLSDLDRGFLNSAFFWTYALLQIPAGWVVDRYSVKFPYAIGFLFWSLTSAATCLVQNIGQLFSARLLLGVGESITTVASLRWIRFHCAEHERGLATGILFSGTKFGAALGVPVAAILVSRFDWRSMFVILGLGGLVWLAAWFAFVKNSDARTLPSSGIPKTTAPPGKSIGLAAMMRTKTMWGIILGTFAYNYFIYFCLTWLPAYLVEAKHLSLKLMGIYTMFSFGGMAVIGILAGWSSDRLIRSGSDPVRVRKIFTIMGFVAASTEIFGATSHSQPVSLFFALFSLAGLGLATANYWALTQTIVPANTIGRVIGVQNFSSNCSGIVAPILTGWLKQITGSYDAPMFAVLIVLILGVFSYGFLVNQEIRQFEAQ
jgi:MFS transporter, ACS family, D-galactonate transporter